MKKNFINYKLEGADVYFSTSENNMDLNKNNTELFEELKKEFSLLDVAFLNQVHGVNIIDIDFSPYKELEGDGLITSKHRVAVGVFTADCVPILIYDKYLKRVSAVHSGWKGTLNSIVIKALHCLDKDKDHLGDIEIFIGPHIRSCCYEVGNEVIEAFNEKGYEDAVKNNMLSLANVIRKDLNNYGIAEKNIHEIELCTKCSKNPKFHSYRRDGKESGRQFSFIYLK